MMKVIFVMLIVAHLGLPLFCKAGASPVDEIVSLISLKHEATQEVVTSKFGQPSTIENSRKQHIWHYSTAQGDLMIYWDNNDQKLEKIAFATTKTTYKKPFDNSYAPYIKAGESKLCDVLNGLGLPQNMTVKTVNQELHYSFQNRMLHMFFRKGTLTNYSFF